MDRNGAPFCAAIRPAWTAGHVASMTLRLPAFTAALKRGAPPASPRLTALVSTSATQPAPISISTCRPPVGTQTSRRSRRPLSIIGRVIAMATPA